MASLKPPETSDEQSDDTAIAPSIDSASKPPEKLALNPLQRGLIFTVKLYQWAISPFLGNNCRFYPSCSHYCIEAMESHGVIKGLYLGIRRVLRCHPYCQGGYDPVPEKHHRCHKNKE